MTPLGNRPLTRRRSRSARIGFTLIELLVSSVLAAMLMLVVVGLLRAANAQSRAARRIIESNPETAVLADQIRRDLVNARHLEIGLNRLRLSGYLGHDWRSGHPTFRPAEVVYAIVSNGRGAWLMRREKQFRAGAGTRSRLDVAWSGAAGLELVRFDDSQGEMESAGSPPGMEPMPSRLIIAIRDRQGKIVLSEEILHHQLIW